MSGVVTRLDDISAVGRETGSGGYRRLAWTDADLTLRDWFAGEAAALGLELEVDRNGNMWAWWGDSTACDAVITGSHLDSVPDGGNYDGPLGVASALAAVADLKQRGITPRRPLAVACFTDEEGGRFGVACIGSRLAAGVLAPERALALRDADGTTFAEALTAVGRDPGALGAERDRLARIGAFVDGGTGARTERAREEQPDEAPGGRWPVQVGDAHRLADLSRS